MTIKDVVDKISSQYQILGPIYLSRFFDANGEKYLYETLKLYHRSRYEDDQRILIVQDQTDEYEYADMPGKSISTLQKYLWEIDISNCFVLIVTYNKNISHELNQARQLYSKDPTSIESILIDGEYQKTIASDSIDTFCVLPWLHVYIGPQGDVLPCCQGNHKFPLGNINDQSIKTIMTSKSANQLRADMLAGQRVKECARCWKQEDAGLSSWRIANNKKYAEIFPELDNRGIIKNFKPINLDIRLSNICNFKCRMCDGYYSSAIAQEDSRIYGKKEVFLSAIQKREHLKEIQSFLPYIQEIYFAGGEPLLSPEHYEILQGLIDCKNYDVKINYNTNFSTLSFKGRSVLDLWKSFKNITVGASLDAMGPPAEYVRSGTVWTIIEENLKLLQREVPHVNFLVTSTLGFMNVRSLVKLQRSWHEQGKLDISKFSVDTMISPNHLTLRILPVKHKDEVDKIIKKHIEWCQQQECESLANQWRDSLKYMWEKDESHFLGEFRKITKLLDQHRSELFVNTFPEYKDLYDREP